MGEKNRRLAAWAARSTWTFCPATMCPLFAADGSPWTGEKNSLCDGPTCAWFGRDGHCNGASAAHDQIGQVLTRGHTLQIGPVQMSKERVAPKQFDCPRAADCQWQKEAGEALCPPRRALAAGVDPRACAY